MRMLRVRFTVRRMMLAVAVAALLLSIGGWLWRRSQEFHERAVIHVLAWRSNDLGTATGSAGAREVRRISPGDGREVSPGCLSPLAAGHAGPTRAPVTAVTASRE